MNFVKKIALFLLFSFFVSTNDSFARPAAGAVALVVGAAASVSVLAMTHGYGIVRNRSFKIRLHKTSRDEKHTWNFVEELFPSKYEMEKAEGEFHAIVQNNVRSFKSKYATDPLYLLHFVDDAESDLADLAGMKYSLQGNEENVVEFYSKKISNSLFLFGLKSSINDLYAEVCRYEKRLMKIVHSIVNSYDFASQLQLKFNRDSRQGSLIGEKRLHNA